MPKDSKKVNSKHAESSKKNAVDKKEKDNVTYGEKVKRRRMEAAEKLKDEGLSISKRRRLVLQQEKEVRNPKKVFERRGNFLLDELLRSFKKEDKEAVCTRVQALTAHLYDDEASPLKSVQAEDTEEVARVYSSQLISRSLQIILKVGSESDRRRIVEELKPFFANLASTSAGHHLCMKLFNYAKSKVEQQDLLSILLANPKTYFTKFGARVWDMAAEKLGTAKIRHRMIMRLFFEKVLMAKLPNCAEMNLPDAIKALDESYNKVLMERAFEILDKAVRKELLNSYLLNLMLSILIREKLLQESHMQRLSEAVFDGADAFLQYKEGVLVLNAISGYWTAKQRKHFLSEFKKIILLNETSWRSYFLNSATALFLARLLTTIDDTRLSTTSILCPIFGASLSKNGKKLQFEDEYSLYDVLQNQRSVGFLLQICGSDKARRYLTQQDLEQLDYPAPTSKKSKDQRSCEIIKILSLLKPHISLDYSALKTLPEKHQEALQLFIDVISEKSADETIAKGEVACDDTALTEHTKQEQEEVPDKSGDDETSADSSGHENVEEEDQAE